LVLNLDEGRQYNEKIHALYKQYGLVVHCSYFGSRLLPCTSYYFLGVGSMTIDNIIEDIRNLRDADFHVCPNETDDSLECTCGHFDQVIDKLEGLKNGK
jgi:hypothetical protein